MAPTQHFLLLFCSLFLMSSPPSSLAQATMRPAALVLPVSKDPSTRQYLARINQRTPLVPVELTLDLGGQYLWVDCEQGYVSSSKKNPSCNTAQCSLAVYRLKTCTVDKKFCVLSPDNTATRTGTADYLTQDVVSIQSTDGSNPGRVVSVPNFLFSCAPTFLLQGLAKGVKGMAGLGRTKISLPSQFSAAFSFPRKFAICLPSSNAKGVVLFGDGPYVLLPNSGDLSRSLTYTPLILNPVSTASGYFEGEPSTDYFIGVKSIRIRENVVPLNASLLSINREGYGGTKISTVNAYTVMETTIYNAVTDTFIRELAKANVPRVAAVAPFGACFNSKNIGSTRVGPAVPQIDLVLQSKNVYWRIFGANSMVQVKDDVLCLGFVDGGVNPRTSIVIGGHQLEDNLLQFDLAASRLGFSSSLLFTQTTCANFNFTSKS